MLPCPEHSIKAQQKVISCISWKWYWPKTSTKTHPKAPCFKPFTGKGPRDSQHSSHKAGTGFPLSLDFFWYWIRHMKPAERRALTQAEVLCAAAARLTRWGNTSVTELLGSARAAARTPHWHGKVKTRTHRKQDLELDQIQGGNFLFLFNNDYIILALVITDGKSELYINGTVSILRMHKYESTFMPKNGSSYHIWKTSGEQGLGELYPSFSSAPKHRPKCLLTSPSISQPDKASSTMPSAPFHSILCRVGVIS